MASVDEKALKAAGEAYNGAASQSVVHMGRLYNAIHAYLSALDPSPAEDERKPSGRVAIEHDGFVGTIIGHYTTLEGKRGVVLQQEGTRVVHVYGEKCLRHPFAPASAKERDQ